MKSALFMIRRCSFCQYSPISPLATRFCSSSSDQRSHRSGVQKCPSIAHFHSEIKSYTETGNPRWALVLFRHLLLSNLNPNDLTFSLLVKACASSCSSGGSIYAKREAPQIQTHIVKLGVDRFVYVSTSLLCLYSEFGYMSHAQKVFDEMPVRDVVSWNALICGYSRDGYDIVALGLFFQMLREGFTPSQTTLVSLVPSCGCQELSVQGKSVHGFGIKAGLAFDSRVKNALTSMYAKSADLKSAELLFEEMSDKSVVSWNAFISAYGQNGLFDKAQFVFKQMLWESVAPNGVTLISLLSANALPDSIHCCAIKSGFTANASVVTSLTCAYAGLGNTESAESLYRSSPQKKLVSLTAIISSYADKGNIYMVLECFTEMLNLGIKPDAVSMIGILQVFMDPKYITPGKVFHGFGLKSGLCSDNLVANGLMSMYARFSDMEAVFYLFSGLHEKTLISWNSVISGCVQAGRAHDAMDLFCQMRTFKRIPDAVTIASLLCACAQIGHLHIGVKLHNYVLRNNLEAKDFVQTSLIDMYAKCGSIENAERVFNSTIKSCLATWNTIISSYSLYGLEHKALSRYSEMREKGLKPDKITFLGLLSACTHSGLIEEGRKYFHIMREEFGLIPGLQHYTCMVSLMGHVGLFEEAIMFIKNMEIEPDSTVWGALLGACCIHQELKLGECLAKKLFFLDYRSGGFYILMSNLYAARERWDAVARVREMMRDTGGDGCSGISLIEVNSVENMNVNSGLSDFHWDTYTLKPVILQ